MQQRSWWPKNAKRPEPDAVGTRLADGGTEVGRRRPGKQVEMENILSVVRSLI